MKLMRFSNLINSGFFNLYIDGFRNLSSWSKKLWIIILIKLFIMFAILKIFFFPDILKEKYDNDKQRSEYVRDQLINSPNNHD
jgi:Na+/H+ antiporter NhaD/arsenite permease-like protein